VGRKASTHSLTFLGTGWRGIASFRLILDLLVSNSVVVVAVCVASWLYHFCWSSVHSWTGCGRTQRWVYPAGFRWRTSTPTSLYSSVCAGQRRYSTTSHFEHFFLCLLFPLRCVLNLCYCNTPCHTNKIYQHYLVFFKFLSKLNFYNAPDLCQNYEDMSVIKVMYKILFAVFCLFSLSVV